MQAVRRSTGMDTGCAAGHPAWSMFLNHHWFGRMHGIRCASRPGFVFWFRVLAAGTFQPQSPLLTHVRVRPTPGGGCGQGGGRKGSLRGKRVGGRERAGGLV